MRHQAITLLTTLYEPTDLILFRPVETWTENNRKCSRVDYRNVCYRTANTTTLEQTLLRLISSSESERTNLFFGVCPRFGNRGRFDFSWQIRSARSLWADVDQCTVDQAMERCENNSLPTPTALVNSGNGVHLYWLLDHPYLIDDVGDPLPVETEWIVNAEGRKKARRYVVDGSERIYINRQHPLTNVSTKARKFQDTLAGIASAIGGDHTTDLTRLLRLPGTYNRKDERNGQAAILTELADLDPSRKYSIADFDRFCVAKKADGIVANVLINFSTQTEADLSDDEIIELASNQRRSGAKFLSLWSGDWESQSINSASEADSSLVFTLAYYTKDAQQIDRIFRRSGLMRAKWDELRGGKTYGQTTIKKALDSVTKQYQRKKAKRPTVSVPESLGFPTPTIDWEFKSDQTENAMAIEFVNNNHPKLRYVPSWKKWLAWDGKRWKIDIDSSRTMQAARRQARNYWDHLPSLEGEKFQNNWASFCRWANCKNSIENVVSLARHDRRVTIDNDQLNQNAYLLNLQNGTIDLNTREFREHRQSDSITHIANVAYDAAAECPKWLAFIDLIFGVDEQAKRYIQALMGYSCSGDVGEHILPICYGSGANGKSTLWNAIVELLGDYAMLAPSKLLLGSTNEHDTIIASLYQRRLVAISEPDEGAKLREARVKELTGDEHITARRMREDYWSFHRTHKFWLSTNHLPRISGTDEGIWRRIKLIPFRVDLRQVTKPIPDYHKLLVSEEGPGILNWLLDGFQDWREHGFIEPESVINETKSYRGKSDEIDRFIEDRCVVDSERSAPSSLLYRAYHEWGGENSQTRFSMLMQKKYTLVKESQGVYRNKRVFQGIALTESLDVGERVETQKVQKTLGI